MSYLDLSSNASTFTEAWSDLSNWYIGDDRVASNLSVESDASLGGFAHIGTLAGQSVYGIPLRSRLHWNKDFPINVKAKVRLNRITSMPWAGVNLYSSEAEYWGTTFSASNSAFMYYWNALWTGAGWAGVAQNGTIYDMEVDYDPSRNPTTRFYIGGVYLGSAHFVPTVHPGVWLGGTYGEAGGTGTVDFGQVVVTGVPVFASTDSGNSQSWTLTNSAHEGGNELGGTAGQIHFHPWAGGLTLMNPLGKGVVYPWAYGPGITYSSGSFSALSPVVNSTAYKFGKLKLAGSIRSGGTLKIYIRDGVSGTLIPDSELSNNSAGFTPVYNSVLDVDLSGISATSIYAEIQGYNSGTATSISGSPTAGPPILKSISIEASTTPRSGTAGIGADNLSITPTFGQADLVGDLEAVDLSITPAFGQAGLMGILAIDSLSITSSFGQANLAGLLGAADMSTAPTFGPADLVGQLGADNINITPQISQADLVGLLMDDGLTIIPSFGSADLQAVLSGGGSIRSPSGQALDFRRVDGLPITIKRFISGNWQ